MTQPTNSAHVDPTDPLEAELDSLLLQYSNIFEQDLEAEQPTANALNKILGVIPPLPQLLVLTHVNLHFPRPKRTFFRQSVVQFQLLLSKTSSTVLQFGVNGAVIG